jgi:hypothetical protein
MEGGCLREEFEESESAEFDLQRGDEEAEDAGAEEVYKNGKGHAGLWNHTSMKAHRIWGLERLPLFTVGKTSAE